VEDQSDAEDVLLRAIGAMPDNREIAANLGFLYARQILSPISRERAVAALERSFNPFVLAGAGTALPNLAMSASGGRQVDESLFQLASSLLIRARRLAPGDPDIQGPMPMISYFSAARDVQIAPTLPPPSGIRIDESVQAAKLTRRTQPEYPELARNAGITGSVKLAVVIARDGTVQSLQTISGHPLLIPAALDAVKTWVYQPTLLNGAPVEVTTIITVSW
jgi:TonB family protein